MYKILLIFGISIIFFFSCEKEDDNGTGKTYFKFKNNSFQTIEIKVNERMVNNFSIYTLQPNEEKTFESICEGEGKGVCGEFIEDHDITIKFLTDNKCLINFPKGFTIASYDNFSTDMYNNFENTLLYLIDAEEVAAATVCN